MSTLKQEMSNNAIENLANNYKSIHEPVQDIIDNSVASNAKKINVYMALSSDPKKRMLVIEDNGEGIPYKKESLKTTFGYGWTEANGSLHEHGFGFKTATAALGHLTSFTSFVKNVDIGFKVSSMKDNEVEYVGVKKSTLDKKSTFSGTRIEIKGIKHSGKKGLSLFADTEEEMINNVNNFIVQLGKTYALHIFDGLKLHVEIENIDTEEVYYDGLVKGLFPDKNKGRHVIEKIVRREDGIEYKILAFEQTADDEFFPLQKGENNRFFYWNNRLILIPSSADNAYGKPVKDAEFMGYREIIIIMNAPGLSTKQTKDGFVECDVFKNLIKSKNMVLGKENFRSHFCSKNKFMDVHTKAMDAVEQTLISEKTSYLKGQSILGSLFKTDIISFYIEKGKDVIHVYEIKGVPSKTGHLQQLLGYAACQKLLNPKAKVKATFVAAEFTKEVKSYVDQINSLKKKLGLEVFLEIASID